MEQVSNQQLMEMMDIVSSSPELRERVSRRIQNNRECKKAYNAKAYVEKKKREKAFRLLQETKAKMEKEANKNRTEEIEKYEQQRGLRMW